LLIADNHLLGTAYAGGVEVRDDSCFYSAPGRLDATIADSTITLNNGGWDGGIDGFYAQGIKVLGNRISGVGDAAINVGTASAFGINLGPTVGWRIIGNDVSDVTPSDAVYGQPPAQIWLGTDAAHCLVVGCGPTTVFDQGTDDTLINVTPVTDPPAAAATPLNALRQFKQPKGSALP
jgi:hypothetical protein